ncbi:hypothetical protein GCM10011380_08810 [Sphingomonas metalli]|uniref:Phage gp6-like head-tail connector protein n=1 Tax=Sphingomonas metalli TaxID=1779358 RepID=A0A916SX61_9SPHN|nr:head-tail connector protein [Sphingomonas metalli]GGB21473.1 hypothetical protein GCM10011380_08810 [Sphingomonas metalli]
MTEPVSLEDIKRHLRLDPEDTDEDAYLTSLLVAARRAVELQIGRAVIGDDAVAGDDLATVMHAVRLIVGTWYGNREGAVVGQQVTSMPQGVTWLLNPLRVFASE